MFLKRFIVFLLVFSYSIVIAHDIIPHHCHPHTGSVSHDYCLNTDDQQIKGTHCNNPICEILPTHEFSRYYQRASGKVKPTVEIIALLSRAVDYNPIYIIPVEIFDFSRLPFKLPERQFFSYYHRRGPPSFIA